MLSAVHKGMRCWRDGGSGLLGSGIFPDAPGGSRLQGWGCLRAGYRLGVITGLRWCWFAG